MPECPKAKHSLWLSVCFCIWGDGNMNPVLSGYTRHAKVSHSPSLSLCVEILSIVQGPTTRPPWACPGLQPEATPVSWRLSAVSTVRSALKGYHRLWTPFLSRLLALWTQGLLSLTGAKYPAPRALHRRVNVSVNYQRPGPYVEQMLNKNVPVN